MSSSILPFFSYNNDSFYGLIIDTGCSRANCGGLNQYETDSRLAVKPEINEKNHNVNCRFGKLALKLERTGKIFFPFHEKSNKINTHIVAEDVPLLLPFADMDRVGIFYTNIANKLHHDATRDSATITRFHMHQFSHWNLVLQWLFMENELRRLHRRFGHLKAQKLHNLLYCSELERVDRKTRDYLKRSLVNVSHASSIRLLLKDLGLYFGRARDTITLFL